MQHEIPVGLKMEKFGTKQKEEKKEEEKPAVHKRKFLHLLDEEHVELKRLTLDDVEEAVKILRKCAFDVAEGEVSSVVKHNVSFGVYVNRMLVGVGLAWPTNFNIENKSITGGEPNAVYMEDPAVLLAYEGRDVRRMLLREREEDARRGGFRYSISYLYEDVPKGSIVAMIKEAGSQLGKLYLSEGYEFYKTEKGILVLKKL